MLNRSTNVIPEGVDVRRDGVQLNAVNLSPLCEVGRVVDPLRSRQYLLASHEHVVAVGVLAVVGVGHGVERPHGQRELVQDEEVGIVLRPERRFFLVQF